MEMLLRFVIQLLLGGLLLWGSIRIVDGHNSKNTFGMAVFWSFMLSLAGIMPVLGLIIGLVVFFMVCTRHYDLGVLASFGVLIVQAGLRLGLGLVLAVLFGGGHH